MTPYLVEGMIKSLNSRDDFTTAVNVGNPNEFTILELALRINWLKVKIVINRYLQTIYAKTARFF
jgi:nucleoside-diphosphate-sugar epimerase